MLKKLSLVVLSLSLTACNWLQPRSNEVASINLSVNNVTPWANISDKMQPKFELSGEQALAKVLKPTQIVQQQTLSAFYLGLGLGYNIAPTLATAPVLPTPIEVKLPEPSSGLAEASVQPSMLYDAANNLFEKVQMLNRDVTDAAIQNHYTPYLVRFKLAVRPYQPHNLPYEVDTRVSFVQAFCDENDKASVDIYCLHVSGATNSKMRHLTKTLKVIPLLVTDDLERQLNASASLTATQLNSALSATLPQGLAGTLNQGYQNQQKTSVSGQAYNNRLSIQRENDTTLLVHIGGTYAGANEDGQPTATLVNQSYDIAALVMVPTELFDLLDKTGFEDGDIGKKLGINVYSLSELRDSETGIILENANEAGFKSKKQFLGGFTNNLRDALLFKTIGSSNRMLRSNRAWDFLKKSDLLDFENSKCNTDLLIGQLVEDANLENYNNFINTLYDYRSEPKNPVICKDRADLNVYGNANDLVSPEIIQWTTKKHNQYELAVLWNEFGDLTSESDSKQDYFQAQSPVPVQLPDTSLINPKTGVKTEVTKLVMLDDKANYNATVTIAGAYGSDFTNMHAKVTGLINPSAKTNSIELYATDIAIDQTAHNLKITFPSLLNANLSTSETSRLYLYYKSDDKDDCGEKSDDCGVKSVVLLKPEVDFLLHTVVEKDISKAGFYCFKRDYAIVSQPYTGIPSKSTTAAK